MNASYALLLLAVSADPAARRAVLLDDFRVLDGTVQAAAGVVRVTPADGPPVVVSANQVLFAGADREAVYTFLAEKADTKSAVGNAQLANWCDRTGLPRQAAAHAKTAAALAPADASLAKLAAQLAEKAARPPEARPVAAVVARPAVPPVELPADARARFGSAAQPVLMNLCASCHAAKGYAGAFPLNRVSDGYANPEATAANLRATADQLSRSDPFASPLLRMALTAHGGQRQPALPGREHPAYQNLERWVRTAVPTPVQVTAVPPPLPEPAKLPQMKAEPLPKPTPNPSPSASEVLDKNLAGARAQTDTAPPPAVNANDPFDPAKFHRLPPGK